MHVWHLYKWEYIEDWKVKARAGQKHKKNNIWYKFSSSLFHHHIQMLNWYYDRETSKPLWFGASLRWIWAKGRFRKSHGLMESVAIRGHTEGDVICQKTRFEVSTCAVRKTDPRVTQGWRTKTEAQAVYRNSICWKMFLKWQVGKGNNIKGD